MPLSHSQHPSGARVPHTTGTDKFSTRPRRDEDMNRAVTYPEILNLTVCWSWSFPADIAISGTRTLTTEQVSDALLRLVNPEHRSYKYQLTISYANFNAVVYNRTIIPSRYAFVDYSPVINRDSCILHGSDRTSKLCSTINHCLNKNPHLGFSHALHMANIWLNYNDMIKL